MNHRKYLNSATLKADPLCGIDTYKDTLNLASGQTTRKIKKLVLTGQENIVERTADITGNIVMRIDVTGYLRSTDFIPISSHYNGQSAISAIQQITYNNTVTFLVSSSVSNYMYIYDNQYTTAADFKSYLVAQYAAGTPVTIWYVLATPTTETISLPSGLSGTLEGLLTQSGTPTPSDPIYPTAVTGEGWYNINTYKRSVLVWNTDTAYERESGAWT